MSSQLVNFQEMEEFLQRLGKCYRYSGTIYLVGGSSLLLAAAKESTFDIDLKLEIPTEHHAAFIHCLRDISHQMKLPVEEASPEEFIPLPAGYQDRRCYVGRYGSLDVFHFDFYSVALSKLHRGNEKDFGDVATMVRKGLIQPGELEQFFNEVLPRVESFSLRADPKEFQRKFTLFKERLAQS